MIDQYSEILKRLNADYDVPGNQLLDEESIAIMEAQLGHVLPDDYKTFLSLHNGVKFDSREFDVDGSDKEFISGSIYGFYGSHERRTLVDIYNQVIDNFGELDADDVEWYPGIHLVRAAPIFGTLMGWPRELLPIGYGMEAHEICLALYGLRPGAIFYLVSNPVEGRQNLYLAASSFDEFIRML